MLPLLLALVAACRAGAPVDTVPVVDFIREFDRADRRPPLYSVSNFTSGAVTLPAIVGPAPGRLTWTLPLPHDGELHTRIAAAAAPVRVRVGVSDNRIYEPRAEALIQPGAPWVTMVVALGRYAGWKPSLFYRPDRVQWHIVLSADAVSGPATVAWARPEVAAPQDAVREYLRRVNSATPQRPTPK